MKKQKLIFGTESYLYGEFVHIKQKKRVWGKQPYMAIITGSGDKFDFRRCFCERGYIKGKTGEDTLVFKLPLSSCLIELGWWSRVENQKECDTIFLQWSNKEGEWVEITKDDAKIVAKEMDMIYEQQGYEYEA